MLRNRNRPGIAAGEPSQRQRRVAEEVRHRLADVLRRTDFRDPALLGMEITVAEVRISPDLKHATIFASLLGGGDITPLLPALKRASPFLRGEVGRGLRLRVIPDLHFQPDAALDEATRINKLLNTPQVRRDLDR